MKWFEHRHHWRRKSGTGVNTIRNSAADRPGGILIIEDCHCGAVRTIEIYTGEAPVVRVASPPEERTD